MIFVTLGTQDKSFTRLLEAVEKEIKNKNIKDKVIVQAGYTKYQSDVMEVFDSIPSDEFEEYIDKASLVITHGGVGSILTALEKGKKVIAAPRLSKYKEHTNDHQKQIISEFAKMGYILPLKDFSKLSKVLEKSKTFTPKKYIPNKNNFQKLISNYIEDVNHTSWYNRDKKIILTVIINYLLFILLNNFGLNSYINLTVSYIFSILLINLLKPKKLNNKIVLIIGFYMLELLLLLLFNQNLSLTLFLTKLIINFIVIIIYHIIDKINDRA